LKTIKLFLGIFSVCDVSNNIKPFGPNNHTLFENLAAMSIMGTIFWDMMSGYLAEVSSYQTSLVIHKDRNPGDWLYIIQVHI
jgi:hypothetical protein